MNERYGTGSIWKTPTGKWRVQVSAGGRRRSIGTYNDKERAEEILAGAMKAQKDLPLLGRTTLYAYGEKWIGRCVKAKVRDARNMMSRWSTVVKDAPFSDLPIEVITRSEIRDWVKSLADHPAKRAVLVRGRWTAKKTGEPISWQTGKNALSLIRGCFADALDRGLVASNPAAGIKLPRRLESTEGWTYLTLTEIDVVLGLPLSAEQRTALTVAIYQGLRQGEIAALRWEDLDFDNGSMLIKASWEGATKSGRVRRIPILAPTSVALRSWRTSPSATGPVFTAPGGGVYGRGYDWGWGDRRYGNDDIPRQAGIARRVRFHDLRHTCGSHLVSGSWGPPWTTEEVAAFLGHADLRTTQRYAHLAPDALHSKAKLTATKVHQHCTGKVVTIHRK
jgi:integrase